MAVTDSRTAGRPFLSRVNAAELSPFVSIFSYRRSPVVMNGAPQAAPPLGVSRNTATNLRQRGRPTSRSLSRDACHSASPCRVRFGRSTGFEVIRIQLVICTFVFVWDGLIPHISSSKACRKDLLPENCKTKQDMKVKCFHKNRGVCHLQMQREWAINMYFRAWSWPLTRI
jgi:hypothetical protein